MTSSEEEEVHPSDTQKKPSDTSLDSIWMPDLSDDTDDDIEVIEAHIDMARAESALVDIPDLDLGYKEASTAQPHAVHA